LGREVKHRNILFTGLPGCGKSTIIEKIVQRINRPCTGFFTKEIRDRGRRVGFSITTLDGQQGTLAHIDIRSRIRVGKYGVNIRDIDKNQEPMSGQTLRLVINQEGIACGTPVITATPQSLGMRIKSMEGQIYRRFLGSIIS
jgi:nucleoside-triphosphatase THEP1